MTPVELLLIVGLSLLIPGLLAMAFAGLKRLCDVIIANRKD